MQPLRVQYSSYNSDAVYSDATPRFFNENPYSSNRRSTEDGDSDTSVS